MSATRARAVMIRGETLTVGMTNTCLVTLCATNSSVVTFSVVTIMLILLLGITRQVYSKSVVTITNTKCRDQVSDQELSAQQNVTKHVMNDQLYETHI